MPTVLLTKPARDALLILIAENYGRAFMDPTEVAQGGYLFWFEPNVAEMLEAFARPRESVSDTLLRFLALRGAGCST